MMNRLTNGAITLAFLGIGGFGTAIATAQDEDEIYPPDESVVAERCVALNRLRSTEVLNDRNILFHMRGKTVYRNVLPRRCPSLQNNRSFSYRTSMNRLCDNDLITVLMDAGLSQMPGPTCTLGKFYPVTEAEVEALRNEIEKVEELGLKEPE